jgi:hypothetical protein
VTALWTHATVPLSPAECSAVFRKCFRVLVAGALQSPDKADAIAAHDLFSQADKASHSVPGRRLYQAELFFSERRESVISAFGCESESVQSVCVRSVGWQIQTQPFAKVRRRSNA